MTPRLGLWALPAALLAMASFALYAALAWRGYEFTDEAFYLLNALHWRSFVATFTLFGFFLELPMRWLGQDLGAMRLLTPLLLSGSGALLGAALARQQRGLPGWVYALMGAVGGLYFFGVFSTMRAPSYNVISLSASMLATAALLRSLGAATLRSGLRWAAAYGVALCACGIAKGTTGLLLAALHLAYVGCVHRDWTWAAVGGRVLAVLAGVGALLALLTWVHPGWPAALRAGLTVFSYDSGSKLGGMFNDFRWDLQRLLPWLPLALALLALWAWALQRARGWTTAAVLALVLALAAAWAHPALTQRWWPLALVAVAALGLAQWWPRQPEHRGAVRRELPLWGLLFLQPFAFSYGTNMPVLWHSQAAAGFVLLAVVIRLDSLWRAGRLPTAVVGLALAALCLPPLVFQVRGAVDVAATYRQPTSLLAQTLPVATPVGALRVDAQTRADLMALQQQAAAAGLRPGDAVMDFTGDGPGRVLAVGARSLAVPWLVGGYPDSPRWAERLLALTPAEALAGAWLFTSPDGPRTIPGWQAPLAARLGVGSHQPVAVIRLARSAGWGDRDKPAPITLCLWRPAAAASVPAAGTEVCR